MTDSKGPSARVARLLEIGGVLARISKHEENERNGVHAIGDPPLSMDEILSLPTMKPELLAERDEILEGLLRRNPATSDEKAAFRRFFDPYGLATAAPGPKTEEFEPLAAEQETAAPLIATKGQEPRIRADAMTEELATILRSMMKAGERVSAGTVMPKLRARAGVRGSCVTEECHEGVLWQREGGAPAKLTAEMLGKRLRRMRENTR